MYLQMSMNAFRLHVTTPALILLEALCAHVIQAMC